MSICYRLLRIGEFSFILSVVIVGCSGTISNGIWNENDCERTNFTYRHEFDGCIFEIPSFACRGRCSSSVEIPPRIWPPQRSCKCCQKIGEEEVVKFIPSCREENKWKRVTIKHPRKCTCSSCGSVEESEIIPQEMAPFLDQEPINGHFAYTYGNGRLFN